MIGKRSPPRPASNTPVLRQSDPLAYPWRRPSDCGNHDRHDDHGRQFPRARAEQQQTRAGKHRAVAGPSLRSATRRLRGHSRRPHRQYAIAPESTTGEHYRRRMSNPDIHLMLKAKIGALSYVGGINLFDSDGALINSSLHLAGSGRQASPIEPISRSFKSGAAIADRSGRTGVQPCHRRLDHRPRPQTDRAERRIPGRHRREASSPRTSKNSSHRSRSETTHRFPWFHRDGTLLARYPHVESMIGHNFKAVPCSSASCHRAPLPQVRLTARWTARTGWVRLAH